MSGNTGAYRIALITIVVAIGLTFTPVAAADDDDLITVGDDELVDAGSEDGPGATAGGVGSLAEDGGEGEGSVEGHDGNGSNGSVDGSISGSPDALNVSGNGSFTNNGSTYGASVRCDVPNGTSNPCNVTTQQPDSDGGEDDGSPGASVNDTHADVSEDEVGAGANVSATDGGSNNGTVGLDCSTEPGGAPSQDDCTFYTPGGGDDGEDDPQMPSASVDDFGIEANTSALRAHGQITVSNGSSEETFAFDCKLNASGPTCSETPGSGGGGGPSEPSLPDQGDAPDELMGPINEAISALTEALGRA